MKGTEGLHEVMGLAKAIGLSTKSDAFSEDCFWGSSFCNVVFAHWSLCLLGAQLTKGLLEIILLWPPLFHESSFLMMAAPVRQPSSSSSTKCGIQEGYCALQPSFYTERTFADLQELKNF